jgi:hypothetical protein
VLPEAFAADPERLTRFEREARTLLLNHAHIAQIYSLEGRASHPRRHCHPGRQPTSDARSTGNLSRRGRLALGPELTG